MQDHMFGQGVEVPVKCFDGWLYVRISAFVYNHASDYQALADLVQRIAARSTASA